ncbi:YjcZ family sporulation protein [Peribacillus glennii]|uniref:YjcZ family sporulation protein n=1 Tax=Peribacillus glennii TaxID=2303991 RepID=A0A372LAK4_9BACI|nr:YjcZ family sporulation protein [Peribacillus glennii]RFU61783.1 YjcZ family sporulation protein [Peribacillus glennii]
MGEYAGGFYGGSFAFIIVVFVLLVIVGCACFGGY